MAEFLTTSGVTYNLERLINEASERLIPVSSYSKSFAITCPNGALVHDEPTNKLAPDAEDGELPW
jgi:hypothetical protein